MSWLLPWLLIAARVAPVALFSPLFGGGLVPGIVQAGFAAGLVAFVASAQPADMAAQVAALPPAALILIAAKEAAIGAVLAVLVAIPVVVAEGAGRVIDLARGAAGEDRVGPSGESTSPLGALLGMAAVVVFFGIGGHLLVVRALVSSYEALPLMAARAPIDVSAAAAGLIGAALALALPAMIAGLVIEVAVGAALRAGGVAARGLPGEVARHVAAIVVLAVGLLVIAVDLAGLVRGALSLVADALIGRG